MKITKFEHACFSVDSNGQSVIVDPGNFTSDFITPKNVIAVVITHEHGDHFDTGKLEAIAQENPGVIIIAHTSITDQLGAFTTRSVSAGDTVTIGPFTLRFYGGEHAVIHSDIPMIANLGVMINDRVFYPGDSFVQPHTPVEVLALPVGAPWLKISETIDYFVAVKPQIAFPTHDAVLSEIGKQVPDNRLLSYAEKIGAKYIRLTEPLEI